LHRPPQADASIVVGKLPDKAEAPVLLGATASTAEGSRPANDAATIP